MEKIFTEIYETNLWGNNNNIKYSGSSGGGSTIDYNKDLYIPFLRNYIIENNIKSVVDLGCGDFLCGELIYKDLNIKYTGYDAYKKLVDYNIENYKIPNLSFNHLDFYTNKETIIKSDICILKDVLQHWKVEEITTFLDYLVENKVFKYILICNCCYQSIDNPVNEQRSTPLSIDYFPLKKYNATKLYNYHTKELSVIKI
jgi:hypothetical protein